MTEAHCVFAGGTHNGGMTLKNELPAVPTQLIDTREALMEVVAHLRASGCFAFDTEFIGENTYHPILCLVQVATGERVELIDPLTINRETMRPFWELLGDERIEKICHAGDQDVEIAWQHSGLVAKNMFDTQIGAGMIGLAYPTALWRVVEHFSGVTLDKAHTYSAWDRRPLSKSQFAYAIDDVRYLPMIHAAMKARIAELGHTKWMAGACDEMCVESAKPADAQRLFSKIRGAGGLNSQQLSVLREVTALREQLAYEYDRPSRAVMKDELLMDLAGRMPASEAALARLRDMPPALVGEQGETLLAAIARGVALPEQERPMLLIPGEDSAEVKRLAETMWVGAQVICLGQNTSPALVTSQNEVLALARLIHKKKAVEAHPLMSGWHRECLGDKLVAFLHGQLEASLWMTGDAGEMAARFAARGVAR
jgi:ribonuclease D